MVDGSEFLAECCDMILAAGDEEGPEVYFLMAAVTTP
jgi:hypothetical protein